MQQFLLVALLASSSVYVAGCDNPILSAVVDSETDPGGNLSVQLDDGAAATLPALAQGSPLTITAQSTTLIVAFTCQADPNGVDAATLLATDGASITLSILPMNGNQLQVHTGGQSNIADSGTISLVTNSDGSLSGTFDAAGHVMSTGAAVTMMGALTDIPNAH